MCPRGSATSKHRSPEVKSSFSSLTRQGSECERGRIRMHATAEVDDGSRQKWTQCSDEEGTDRQATDSISASAQASVRFLLPLEAQSQLSSSACFLRVFFTVIVILLMFTERPSSSQSHCPLPRPTSRSCSSACHSCQAVCSCLPG